MVNISLETITLKSLRVLHEMKRNQATVCYLALFNHPLPFSAFK